MTLTLIRFPAPPSPVIFKGFGFVQRLPRVLLIAIELFSLSLSLPLSCFRKNNFKIEEFLLVISSRKCYKMHLFRGKIFLRIKQYFCPISTTDNRMLPDRKAATIRNNARSLPFACTLIMLYKEARIL